MKEKNEVRMVWRWDDIFRVYRCPYCGRPEKPCFELRDKKSRLDAAIKKLEDAIR